MLSVVIATQDSERTLVPTLGALVPGAVAGVVREVIIADAGSCDGTAGIADAAGCRLLALAGGERGVRLKAAADIARAPWLLFLEPGAVPDATWIDETRRFVVDAEPGHHANHRAAAFRAAAFRAAATANRPLLLDAIGLMWSALGIGSIACRGLLIARSHYDALGGHRDVADCERELNRRLGRRRIVLLRTSVITARA